MEEPLYGFRTKVTSVKARPSIFKRTLQVRFTNQYFLWLQILSIKSKVNSVQKACVKCFAVHELKLGMVQTL